MESVVFPGSKFEHVSEKRTTTYISDAVFTGRNETQDEKPFRHGSHRKERKMRDCDFVCPLHRPVCCDATSTMAILPFRFGCPSCASRLLFAILIRSITSPYRGACALLGRPPASTCRQATAFVPSASRRLHPMRRRALTTWLAQAVDHDGLSSVGAQESPSAAPRLPVLPSTVTLESVSLQFPRTLSRRLFASDPRRDDALRNVTMTINSTTGNFVLLAGESSSGKSALLNVIRGRYQPTSGSAMVSTTMSSGGSPTIMCRAAKPVYLDDPRRDTHRDESFHSVGSVVDRHVARLAYGGAGTVDVQPLVDELSRRLELDVSSRNRIIKPCELSQSESYRFGLLLACLESMLDRPTFSSSLENNCDVPTTDLDNEQIYLPAPILLLDEVSELCAGKDKLDRLEIYPTTYQIIALHAALQWMDKEGTSVVRNVQSCLERLAEMGAVICCATHKPERYRMSSLSETAGSSSSTSSVRLRHVAMRSGQIVSDTFGVGEGDR
jgi:energy-coupling factor transporter ATP-binding protein EcfA2